jgi:hypothetical protein
MRFSNKRNRKMIEYTSYDGKSLDKNERKRKKRPTLSWSSPLHTGKRTAALFLLFFSLMAAVVLSILRDVAL